MRNKGLDLRHHSFGRAMRGLDETEVLSFLQATAPDYEQAHAEVASLRQQLDDTAVELRRLQEQERTVTRLLVAAEEDARTRLDATAKDVAEIERKAEDRARALVASAETQHARMQDEVRAIVGRRSIAASGLTELIDALSRRAGQERPKAAAAAAPAPAPARVAQPAPASTPPAVQPVPAIKPQPVLTVAPPPPPAIAEPPSVAPPALPAEPISLLDLSPKDTAVADASASEPATAPDVSLSTDVVDSSPDAVEVDAPSSRRAWWVAAAGIVLAVTTAAALGVPRIGSASGETRPPQSKPVAPAPPPKPVASDSSASRPPAATVVTPAVTPAAPLAVTLKANRQCWLRLVVDGRTETKTLVEGEELARSADREIELRVGDAAAIAVTVNGRTLAPLGRSGQVIDTVFHADLTSPH